MKMMLFIKWIESSSERNALPFLHVVRRTARYSGLPDAEAIVKSDLYVNDYLKSAPTDIETIQNAELTSLALSFGDFHLQNRTFICFVTPLAVFPLPPRCTDVCVSGNTVAELVL